MRSNLTPACRNVDRSTHRTAEFGSDTLNGSDTGSGQASNAVGLDDDTTNSHNDIRILRVSLAAAQAKASISQHTGANILNNNL